MSIIRLIIRIFCLGVFILAPSTVSAQSYHAGYQYYIEGNYSAAELAFKKAMNYAKTPPEKTRLYKMLGISQYMLGKRIESASSFKKAKNLNPGLSISSSEVLDESVLPFFDSIKPDLDRVPRPPAKQVRSSAVIAPKKKEETSVIVKVNVAKAKIQFDGSLSTVSGKKVVLKPGIHELSITASGYKGIAQPVNLKAGAANVFNVKLVPIKHPGSDKKEAKKARVASDDSKNKKDLISTKSSSSSKGAVKAKNKKHRVRRKKAITPSKKIGYVTFLPFGIGQFANDETGSGIAYALGQATSLGFGFFRILEGNSITTETDSELTKRIAIHAEIANQIEADRYWSEEIEAYKLSQDTKSADAFFQGNIGLGVFGALWLASVAQGYFFAKSPQKRKNARRTSHLLRPARTDYNLLLEPASQSRVRLGLKLSLSF